MFGASISTKDTRIFFWKENNTLKHILICHLDDIVYGSTNKSESKIISTLRQTFKFDREDPEAFK